MADDSLLDLRHKHSNSIAAALQRARSALPEIDDDAFADTIASSVTSWSAKLTPHPSDREIDDYIRALHVEDLALTLLCRRGDIHAWEKLIDEHRSVLYVSARAVARDETVARELADGLWAELYGLGDAAGPRRSLLEYFHGRSSLKTWLRAVLAQRFIDHQRSLARDERIRMASESAADATADDDPPDLRWAVGEGGAIERFSAGNGWIAQTSGVRNDFLAGSALSADVCWVVGRGGIVLRTTDGEHWEKLSSPVTADLTAVTADSADSATITANDAHRYVTTDGGTIWRPL